MSTTTQDTGKKNGKAKADPALTASLGEMAKIATKQTKAHADKLAKGKGESPLEGPVAPKAQTSEPAKAKGGKGPKQLPIPGTERKTPPAIEKAVLKYREARDERMAHTKLEQAAYANLVKILEDNGVDLKKGETYEFKDEDGRAVRVVAEIEPETVKVKVKNGKSDDEED